MDGNCGITLYCRTEHSWKTNFEQDLITEHTIAEQKKI